MKNWPILIIFGMQYEFSVVNGQTKSSEFRNVTQQQY